MAGTRLTAVVGMLCLLIPSATLPTPMPVAAAPSPAERPRLAFTDDRDELRLVGVRRTVGDGEPDTFSPAGERLLGTRTTHQGEGSYQRFGELDQLAFVSTRGGDRDGEVHVAEVVEETPGLTGELSVTCANRALETHPAVSSDGRVAYASDIDGDWDLYLATPVGKPVPPGERVGGTCAQWAGTRLTNAPGNDLWPAWVPASNRLVFSSTRDDPLGDLYALDVDEPVPVRRLTDDPAADTQPAVTTLNGTTPTWIAFSTSRYRRDGSIGLMPLFFEDEPPVTSAWDGAPLQSSEPSWSGSSDEPYLAFTSTHNDPYGDVWVAQISPDYSSRGAPWVVGEEPVAAKGGVAESHPTWRNVFDDQTVDLISSSLTPTLAIDENDYAELVITRRSQDGDIGDVVAASGEQRRIIVAGERVGAEPGSLPDERGPSYSPDGTRIAYSRDLLQDRFGLGRGFVVANADGTGPRPLVAERGRGDVDIDPVWSPDGARIAFTRYDYLPQRESYAPPAVWVVEVAGGDAHSVSVAPGRGLTVHDVQPTWSPDGRRIAVSRRVVKSNPEFNVAPLTVPRPSTVWIVDADDGENGVPLELDGGRSCAVLGRANCAGDRLPGRSPAWSPDGARIAFQHLGAIYLASLAQGGAAGPKVPEQVTGLRAVTGFGAKDAPTPNRAVVSAADDPAWSPDGAEIAFTGQPAGQPDQRGIYAVRPDGTGLRVVAQRRGPETEPAYQPYADLAVALTAVPPAIQQGTTTTLRATVTNRGPSLGAGVRTTTALPAGLVPETAPGCSIAAGSVDCVLPALGNGDVVAFDLVTRGATLGLQPVSVAVDSDSPDPAPANNRDRAVVEVTEEPPPPPPPPPPTQTSDVAVDVVLQPDLGWTGGRIDARFVVTNTGPGPAEDVVLQSRYADIVTPFAAQACLETEVLCGLGTLEPGARRVLRAQLRLNEAGQAQVVGHVSTTTEDTAPGNDTDSASLRIRRPRLRLLPAVVRPGYVTLAYGEDMPPGSRVRLRWDRGITVDQGPFTVAEDGTLRVPLLVVRHDELGRRSLVAGSVGGLFRPVRAQALVAPRLLSPPQFLGRG